MIFFACYLTAGAMWSLINYYILREAAKLDPTFNDKMRVTLAGDPLLRLCFTFLPLMWPIHVTYFLVNSVRNK